MAMQPDKPDNNRSIPPEIMDLHNSGQVTSSDIVPMQKFRDKLIQSAPPPRAQFQSELSEKLQLEYARQQHRTYRLPSIARVGIRPVLAIMVVAIIGAGVVLAINTLLWQFISDDDGLQSVDGIELNLSATIDDFTLNIEWGHMDANRLSIGFAVSGFDCPDEQYLFCDVGVRLLDEHQAQLPLLSSQGQDEGETRSYLYNFDASSMQTQSAEIEFQLEVEPFGVTLSEPSDVGSTVMETIQTPLNAPLILTFSLGTNAQARVLNVVQSAKDSGYTLSLHRVILTPSQTRVLICFMPPDLNRVWTTIPYLTAGDVEVAGGGAVQPIVEVGEGREEETCNEFTYNAAMFDYTGEWRLEIRELVGMGDVGTDQQRIPGSWVFDFVVP